MEFLDIVKTRRSIREYSDKPVPKQLIEDLVDAARFAPTARNIQPWEFVIITGPDNLKRLSILAENGKFIAQAKACIAVFSSDTKYYLEDCCAATENILLMARAQGLASCWVAGDKKPYCSQVNSLLNVPATFKLVSLVSLGYPKSEKSFNVAEKRILKEVIHWERM